MILEGAPFKGKNLEQLKKFLAESDLEYDSGIEYSICVLDDDCRIIGTGSVERNVIKCIAIDSRYRGQGISAQIISGLLEYEFEKGRSHILIYTKPANREMFEDMGFYCIMQTEEILFMENRKNGFEEYMEELVKETPEAAMKKNGCIGAIVANCNPFTYGHRYLIQKAMENCDFLHMFIVSDDRSFFSAEERFTMAEAGIEGIVGKDRIILHHTSEYMISAATFPTYFFKDRMTGEKANCILDLRLFAERIALPLNITKRFVGTEPFCKTTGEYNQKMKDILPLRGIEVIEIERLALGDEYISASQVRKCIMENQLSKLEKMLPDQVYKMLCDSRYQKRGTENG